MKTYEEKLLEVATAIMPECINTLNTVLMSGHSCREKSPQLAASKMAIRYASTLLSEVHAYSKLFGDERANY